MEVAVITNSNHVEDFREIGRQFAYEGLNETYLKDPTPEELDEFRIGYEEVINKMNTPSTRNDDFLLSNESRLMHR